jgi:hypothetical protein
VRRIGLALLLTLSLLVSLPPAFAAATSDKDSTYVVEIVVFSTLLPQLEGDELWTRDAAKAAIPGLEDAEPSGPPTTGGWLADAENSLNRDGRFHVLAHYRWTQTAEARSVSRVVRIRGTDPNRPTQLDGTVRLYLSRYLHVDMNLAFQPDAAAGRAVGAQASGASDNPATITFRINEQRRIKSQETNYFDHPKFGALLRVTQVGADR